MAGIDTGIAAMENWRTAVLGEAHKRNQGDEKLGLDAALNGFLLDDAAGLSQRSERESIRVEMSTRFKNALIAS